MSPREIPLVGGPGDGRRVQTDGHRILPSIRWHGPDPDAQVVAGFDGAGGPDDNVVFAILGRAAAVYHHRVAVRHDAHPCKRGASMVAEWDAYVWDQVRDLHVQGNAMGIPPSRFRVTARVSEQVWRSRPVHLDVRPALASLERTAAEFADIERRRSPHPSADPPRGLEQ